MSKKMLSAALASMLVAAAVIVALVVLQRSAGTNANSSLNEPVPAPPVNGPTTPPPQPPSTMKGDSDVIHVWAPPWPGAAVSSPLTVEGEARGTWYFEATFPMKLLDGNGKVIAEHYAEAQGDWMTSDYVPFKGTLEFKTPDTAEGTLVLQKDNPSGLPEHDDELRVAVSFIPFNGQTPPTSAKPCIRTGCSGQVCSDEEVITTCEYRTEYACYKTATCERQPATGACEWTRTPELLKCIGT